MTGDAADGSVTLLREANALRSAGHHDSALRLYDQVVALDARNALAFCERGNALADLGRTELALESYGRAIALDPAAPEPYDYRAIVLARSGRMHDALDSLDKAVALDPGNLNAQSNRSNVLKSLGRLEEALAAQDHIVAALPHFAPGHNNRGNTLMALGRFDQAIASFDRALEIDPGQVHAHRNRASALLTLNRREEAIESYRRAIALDPNMPDVALSLAELLAFGGHPQEAAAWYERAISLDGANVNALLGFGGVLFELSRLDLALSCYRRVLSLDPGNSIALCHMAMVLVQLDRHDEALKCFDRSVALLPENAQAWQARGLLLEQLGDIESASVSHNRALELVPAFPYQLGHCFHMSMRLSRWGDFGLLCERLRGSIQSGERSVAPFDFIAAVDHPALQKQCAAKFVRDELPHLREVPIGRKYARHERIRIGYFSADFFDHATMRLLLETLEAHDRGQFELFAISFGPDTRDPYQQRTSEAVDRFIDVRQLSDREIVQLARDLEIDIAVDLKGFTHGNRSGIFVERTAPLQVNYLGFPGTLGIPAVDYIFADETLVPDGLDRHYSEKVVYLPGSYQPNSSIRDVEASTSREKEGLPEDAFVYCCFNQNYKITPDVFHAWMRILRQVAGSVLWLWVNDSTARINLQHEAAGQGIAPDRLIFAGKVSAERHLDRLRMADLFLDTLPYNAHTTASDALRMGVPVLTCTGEAFASRVAASLLNAMDLPELVTSDPGAYEVLAIALGTDKERFARLREKLRRNLAVSGLFDPVATARKLEAAYTVMYERYQGDLAPAPIRFR